MEQLNLLKNENGFKAILTSEKEGKKYVALSPQFREIKENEILNDAPYFELSTENAKALYNKELDIYNNQRKSIEEITREIEEKTEKKYQEKIIKTKLILELMQQGISIPQKIIETICL